jgi:outer membrane protein OmpA-like peptidoglycan-associated protein
MVEFTVIGPLITLLGLAMLQYGLLYFTKNQYNHASFMAARAGSTGHADIGTIENAYARALVPLYGGGTDPAKLEASYQRALADVKAQSRIELLNPTAESYRDFNSSQLQARYNLPDSKHVIPNSGQAYRPASVISPLSGQNIQDANLLKLRITTGYRPQVPLVGAIYARYLKWADDGSSAARTALLDAGRIPVVTHVTVQMQSDAIEGPTVTSPGMGNGGAPADPGMPPGPTSPPPACATAFCTKPPSDPAPTPTDPGGLCPNGYCEVCPKTVPVTTTLPGDINFAFGRSTLTAAGMQQLDTLIVSARTGNYSSVAITGYTDQIGSAAENLALSQARAQTARQYLIAHGLTDRPITATGAGATNLKVELAQCSGKTGAALQACLADNRRVEVTLIP